MTIRLPHPVLRRPSAAEFALGALAVAVAFVIFPVAGTASRLAIVVGVAVSWALAVFAARRRPALVAALVVPVLAGAVFLCLPGRSLARAPLRDAYVRALARYGRAPYVWGGERLWGIDCSGLARMALVDALVERGLAEADPGALRTAADLWWHDASAAELGQGYGGRTLLLSIPSSVNAADARPGDLAVSGNGMHVVICTAKGAWIEADPRFRGVRTVATPSADGYYPYPARIVRWKALTDPAVSPMR
ncbi:MAG: NlpC/P60 family protein [Actinobacteria bacterium]|nr:MAG: NlpC/P60 family protein [Actinomycetota bacterium]